MSVYPPQTGMPPQYPYQSPPPRKSWPRRHKLLTAFLSSLGLILIVIIIVVAASSPSVTKPSPPAPSAAAPATSAAPTPTPSPSPSLSGPVGTVYQASDGSGDTMTVQLTSVVNPAQGSDQFDQPTTGNYFVGAVFALKGVSGTFADDANSDATLVGSNGQTYTADFDSIAGYTNFNSGSFSVSPGVRSVGAVTFQVPAGVKVSAIQWSANSGLGGTPATWTLR